MNFTIPGALPTLNEIIDASKSHWSAYAEMKKTYTQLVVFSCSRINKMNYVDVSITWYCKNKKNDPDNVASGTKFILDGLVTAGKLENDGWANIRGISHKFLVDSKKPRIEVVLTEVLDDE